MMSICCYAEKDGKKLIGAERYTEYRFVSSESDEKEAMAVFEVKLSKDVTVIQKYKVSKNGVDITLSGCEKMGFMVPVFDYDGENSTDIVVMENSVSVKYQNAICRYCFEGDISFEYKYYYNRNGRYRVYEVAAQDLHIKMEEGVCET